MGVKYAELKKDGRKVKQSFTGTWTTYIITSGGTTTQFTSPNVKVSGQVVYWDDVQGTWVLDHGIIRRTIV